MPFIEKVERLLASNHIKEVIDEYLNMLANCPQSNKDARADANELRSQIIVLSGKYNGLQEKINLGTVRSETADVEKSEILNAFTQKLNQLPSIYPALYDYILENDEEESWREAQHKNTIDAYHHYFNKYPNGKYKADTLRLISELEDLKQKQDNEFKKLALQEKERRENDKIAAESQKIQDGTKTQPTSHAATTGSLTSPKKSKTGLIIGAGVILIAAVIIFLMTNKNSSANGDASVSTSEQAGSIALSDEAYKIDKEAYYFLENRENSKIMAVMNGLNAGNEGTDWEYVVVVDSTNKEADDWKKIQLWEQDGTYMLYAGHSDRWFSIDNIGFLNQEKDTVENSTWQLGNTFKMNKYKDGYFQIETLQKGNFVLGLHSASKGSTDGQKISIVENDGSPQTQWKLILTKLNEE